jgi:hypothetical protein
VKKKNNINGEELESINGDLFHPFDPEDETWIVGGSKSITTSITYTPNSYDGLFDVDYESVETPS